MSSAYTSAALAAKFESPTEKLVLVTMSDWASGNGLVLTTPAELADFCCCTARTAQKCISELVKAGLVHQERAPGQRGSEVLPGHYRLLI